MSDDRKDVQADQSFDFDDDDFQAGAAVDAYLSADASKEDHVDNIPDFNLDLPPEAPEPAPLSAGKRKGKSAMQAPEDAPKTNKKGTALVIGGALLGVGVVLGGLGWVAVQVLSPQAPGAPAPSEFASNQFSAPQDSGSNSGFGDVAWGDPATNGFGSSEFGEPVAEQAQAVSSGGSGMVGADNSNSAWQQDSWGAPQSEQAPVSSIVISQGLPQVPDTQQGDMHDPVGVAGISDEERLYDQLLAKAEAMDVPMEAIKIDQTVVRQQVESQRLRALESEVTQSRESIGAIRSVVSEISGQVGEIAKSLETSNETQRELAKRVDEIGASVAAMDKQSDAFVGLEQSVKRMEQRTSEALREAKAARDEARKAAGSRPVEVAAASQPRPVAAPVPAPAPKPVTQAQQPAMPAPQPPVAAPAPQPVAPVTAQAPAVAVACANQRVSSVWRVKGVNANTAYIVRAQDRTGTIVREGMAIPGFGTVLSFDTANRTICTTDGVIQR